MLNRIAYLLGEQPREETYGAFYVVSGSFGSFAVTVEVARAIEEILERRRPPRWLVFRDRSGSHVRVRTRELRVIYESTPEQRSYDRRMERLREEEERDDRRPWDDTV